MNYILFDGNVRNSLLPFTYTRPVADIRVGILTIREKWEKILGLTTTTISEEYLEEKYPMVEMEENVLINSSFLPTKELAEKVKSLSKNQAVFKGEDVIAFFTSDTQEEVDFALENKSYMVSNNIFNNFIKILSYLLQNIKATNGEFDKSAIEFFKDKKLDGFLLGEIDTAITKENTVILFNIDAKANTDDGDDAVLKVFLKVFNEQMGFSGDHPHIAHLERELASKGLLDAFHKEFFSATDMHWVDNRDSYDFYRDDMADALGKVTKQSTESARQWVYQLENNFTLDVTNFCKWVKEYLDGNIERRVLFFVDEVGQFIGNNTQMMLKLQTITENLGTVCEGRAWVVVTSQEDIDSVIGQMKGSKGHDFSKIQGRFERLSLSSSNTSEVIEKRLLSKDETARDELQDLYDQKGDILRNQLAFDNTTTAELANYKDASSFVHSYPFVPYHYTLVQKIFEAIRKAGATGLHLSRGERSLLDAFQSAAKQVREQEVGVLIPLYYFYPAIESFLDTSVKKDIDQASDKDSISPFALDILKTLFLILI